MYSFVKKKKNTESEIKHDILNLYTTFYILTLHTELTMKTGCKKYLNMTFLCTSTKQNSKFFTEL